MPQEPDPRGPSVLGPTREDHIWTLVLLGGGGIVVLLVAPIVAGWLAEVPFIPFAEPLRWVGGFDEPWQWAARAGIGLVAGLVLAVLAIADEHRLEVDDDQVVVIHGDDRRTLRRDMIVGIHRDGGALVIDGTQGRTLLKKKIEAPKDAVRDAFVSRGYPWESN